MDLAKRLDPAEVLEHLKQLGYTGITPDQLKAFMNDLKKLIIHDQMMTASIPSTSSYNSSSSLTFSPSSSSQTSGSSFTSASCESSQQGASSTRSTSCTLESSATGYERVYPGKENADKMKKAWSTSASDLKPKSAFIRPWNLGMRPPRSARSDPVSLYHHYKTIWEHQKFPGENDHADLRWLIRERMMGQDPHPTTSHNILRPTAKGFRL